MKCFFVYSFLLLTIRMSIKMSKSNVKDSWDDSSDEEEEVEVEVKEICHCYVCNHDLENDTGYYPQCENKALLERMIELDESDEHHSGGSSPTPPLDGGNSPTPPLAGESNKLPYKDGEDPPYEDDYQDGGDVVSPPYEDGGEGEDPPYDEYSEIMDKKMGRHITCR